MNKNLIIAANLFEDLISWKNLKQAELSFKCDPTKIGSLSLNFHSLIVANKIYKQVKDLSLEDLEEIKLSFTDDDWFTITNIITEARNNYSGEISL